MTSIFGILLCLRHLNPVGVDFHVTLNLHLDGGSNWELHFRAMLQQRPCHAPSDSRKAANPSTIQASRGNTANAADRSTDGRAFGRIFDPLAGVLVLLDCSFRVLHAFVIRTRTPASGSKMRPKARPSVERSAAL